MRASWIALGGLVLCGGLLTSAAAQVPADLPVEVRVDGTSQCLTSSDRGATVVNCAADTRQKWELVRAPNATTLRLRQFGTQTCLAATGPDSLEMRNCVDAVPALEWTLGSDKVLASSAQRLCLRSTDGRIGLVGCRDAAALKWVTRVAEGDRPDALPSNSSRYTLNQIRNGDRCLTNFQDQASGKYRARFESCGSGNSNQLWVFTQFTGTSIASTRESHARIVNARTGGCLDFDGAAIVVQQCNDRSGSQDFRAYFRSLQTLVNSGRDTLCLTVGADGMLGYGLSTRNQCSPINIWNNEAFKFASTAIPFVDWTPPPPPPPPPVGTVKSIRWIAARPIVPASGIDDEVYQAIAVAEWAMVVRSGAKEVAKTVAQNIVMSEVENQYGEVLQNPRSPARVLNWLLNDATSPAYILGRLDAAFSSSDDLYVKMNQYVVWPAFIDDMSELAALRYTPHESRGPDNPLNLYSDDHPWPQQYHIDLMPGETASFSAWDWDSGSDNDLLAEITLSYDIPVGTHRYLLMSKVEHSVYEFEFNVMERPYWSCSGNIRHCTFEAPPQPRWP